MERKLVLQSCLKSVAWGLVEMSILLTDDIVEFDMLSEDWGLLDMQWQHSAPEIDVKLDYLDHSDMLIPLLIAKCPVSNGIRTMTKTMKNILFWH